jgi:hypothetical protein
MASIAVRCDADDKGWICTVTLAGPGNDLSRYEVRVRSADLERFAPGANEPAALVERSFAFLLEREAPAAILRSFDLPDIERYFPEYPSEMRRRATGG